MAGNNSNIKVTDLDFNTIKNNLKTFLQSQDVLKDYNYEGSALSTLLDILAYNTQYNAYYLNMVANEMFLDSAIKRGSVTSHAKLLNYTPKSAIAPTATINLRVNQVNVSSLTMPKFTSFLSEAIDGVNYNFVTTDSYTVNTTGNVALFTDVKIKQGLPTTTTYTVDLIDNPRLIFEIPETNIDTTSLSVTVQQSGTNTTLQVFDLADSYLSVDGDSTVYFLQENTKGLYEVCFGDGILGKKLVDGNIVNITYIVTEGTASTGANNFVLMDPISGYANTVITPIFEASQGGEKETIESIKFQAPKAFSAQKRAVTKEDYITAIQQNKLGYSFDAVNVWGGEQNDPPVYGRIFVAIKPAGVTALTEVQKQKIIQEIIKPICVMTVEPTILDPDFTYLKINSSVVYDPKKTVQSANAIGEIVKTSIRDFTNTNLNSFESTFSAPSLLTTIQNSDPSIVTNEFTIRLEKKFLPNLLTPQTYKLYFGSKLKRGILQSGVASYPAMSFRNPSNLAQTLTGIFLEEVPTTTNGIESIVLTNPGFGYQYVPTVEILGDGTGATAVAVLSENGSLRAINVTNAGSNYTSAILKITPAAGDTTGQLAAGIVNLQGRYGRLRLYYNDSTNVKVIFNNDIGTIDYEEGVITLNSFGPLSIDNPLGILSVSVTPDTTILSSSYNRILTVDTLENDSIVVNVRAKT